MCHNGSAWLVCTVTLSGRHPDPSRVADAGLRVITYDRPGYGRSARDRGRAVVCTARELE